MASCAMRFDVCSSQISSSQNISPFKILSASACPASIAICIRDSSVSEAGGLAHIRRACRLTKVRVHNKVVCCVATQLVRIQNAKK